MAKVLLVTDIPPCRNFTAGLVLDDLCRFFSPGEIACFTILNPELDARLSPDLAWIPIEYCPRPNESGGAMLPGPLGTVSSLAREFYNAVVKTPAIVDRAVRFGRAFGAEKVWCILQGQTMVRVARAVADGIGAPLVVQIWDPFEWWLRAHRVNRLSSALLLRQFATTIGGSDACFAASPYMAEEYRRRYGVKAVHFTPSLGAAMAYPAAEAMHAENEIVLAMAGQLYAIDEWHALLQAVNESGWVVGGRRLRIVLLGKHDNLILPEWARPHVTKTGWLSQRDTIAVCNGADLLYCPYWFSKDFEQEARLSFPSKLTTYFASGRPVLYHGPRYASPARFLEAHGAGFICDTVRPQDIRALIERISSNPAQYRQVAAAAAAAFKDNMTTTTLMEKFAEFLGTHENSAS